MEHEELSRKRTLIVKRYEPPRLIRWLLHTSVEVIKNDNNKKIRISMVVENFRALFYYSFLLIVLFGIFLTKMFTKVDSTAILMDVFGAPNVCAYFDFPPSTYFLPFCWIFAMLYAIIYDVVSMFRIWIAYEEGRITSRERCWLFTAHIYFIFTVMLFTMIFAVTPDRDEPYTMLVHAVPYLNLKIAMCVLQFAVVWFGTQVAWKDIDFPRHFTEKHFYRLSWFHVILQIVIMVISNICLLNALGDMGPEKLQGAGVWWDVHNNEAMTKFGDIVANKASFLLNILFPLCQSQFLSCQGFKYISNTHAVIISIGDNMEPATI